ncbi:unnamed protein product [Pleuronectes platessa]|uniref:Uncharacterized protein n=1 Tax=Pleuronectes platessa TaxID=8262 RepID=A0A9N7UEV9_PLEPL|nr:unnamed protein product [Pleuronectes platessa]
MTDNYGKQEKKRKKKKRRRRRRVEPNRTDLFPVLRYNQSKHIPLSASRKDRPEISCVTVECAAEILDRDNLILVDSSHWFASSSPRLNSASTEREGQSPKVNECTRAAGFVRSFYSFLMFLQLGSSRSSPPRLLASSPPRRLRPARLSPRSLIDHGETRRRCAAFTTDTREEISTTYFVCRSFTRGRVRGAFRGKKLIASHVQNIPVPVHRRPQGRGVPDGIEQVEEEKEEEEEEEGGGGGRRRRKKEEEGGGGGGRRRRRRKRRRRRRRVEKEGVMERAEWAKHNAAGNSAMKTSGWEEE